MATNPNKNMDQPNQDQKKGKQKVSPQSKTFNDKDMLNDMLISLKALSNIYNTFLHEASNDAMVELLDELHADIIDLQRDLFDTMSSLGWYQLEQEDETKIDQAIQQAEQERPQLGA